MTAVAPAAAENKSKWLYDAFGVDLHHAFGDVPRAAPPAMGGDALAFANWDDDDETSGGGDPQSPKLKALLARIEKGENPSATDLDGLAADELNAVTAALRKRGALLQRRLAVQGKFANVMVRYATVMSDRSYKENTERDSA